MKKRIALVMAVAMTLSLASCGSSGSGDAASGTAAPAPISDSTVTVPAGDIVECEPQTWRFVTSASENTPITNMGYLFNQYISERTNGAITVEVYTQDILTSGNQQEGIQSVIDGDNQLSAHPNLIYAGFDQRLNVLSLPFIFDSTEDVDALLSKGNAGYEALAPIVEALDLHLLGVGENGFRHITNSKRPIESLKDLAGLKIRIPNTAVLTYAYTAWGANWQIAAWSEVYTGLQQGTYDGQENPLPTADGGSIQEVNKFCTYWTGLYDCVFFTINQDTYDSLSPELQALCDEAGQWAADQQRTEEREGDEVVLKKWEDAGVTISYLSDEAVAEFREAAASVPAEWAATCVKDYGFAQAEMDELISIFMA